MKPRARRVTIAAAVLGAAVVGVFVVAHWGTVREHVEAWHFQLTRETKTLEPAPALKETPQEYGLIPFGGRWQSDACGYLLVLSTYSGLPVVFDSAHEEDVFEGPAFLKTYEDLSKESALRVLRAHGWRILEQRFPRGAYIIIRHEIFYEQMKAMLELRDRPVSTQSSGGTLPATLPGAANRP